ncbi:MAG: nucleotidyltransferase domain-containing protein [Nanoarchaeota archaeon]
MSQKRYKELDVIALYSGDYKARFYLRQISRLAKIPLKTCQNILVNLEKDRVLKGQIEGKNKYFSLNLDNISVKSLLLKAEIHKTDIFLEKYPEFKMFLKSINTNALLIIFGSFAKFKADKYSDLDLFIISDKEENLPAHLLPHKIHQNSLKEISFKKAIFEKETLIKEIESYHILFNNPSSYVNIIWEYYGK